jgi:transposase
MTRAPAKRRSTRLRKGAPWLKTTLIQCACAAIRKKGSYLQAQFHRLRARRGAKKAISLWRFPSSLPSHHMVKDGTCPTMTSDPITSTEVPKKSKPNRLLKRLTDLGYAVTRRHSNPRHSPRLLQNRVPQLPELPARPEGVSY